MNRKKSDFIKITVWNIWMSRWKKYLTYIGIFVIILISTLLLARVYDAKDMPTVLIKIISDIQSTTSNINNEPIKNGLIFALNFLLPAIVATGLFTYIKYKLVFPADIEKLLRRVADTDSNEVKLLARGLLVTEVEDIGAIVKGAPDGGYAVAKHKIPRYAKDVVKATNAKCVFMTTLVPPLAIYKEPIIKAFTKEFLDQIKDDKKKLVRICVGNDNDFEDKLNKATKDEIVGKIDSLRESISKHISGACGDEECLLNLNKTKENIEEIEKCSYILTYHDRAIKWFKDAHRNENTVVYKLDPVAFRDARPSIVDSNKLDVLLFDDHILFALENDPDTLELQHGADCFGRPTLKLHFIGKDHVLEAYRQFFNNLIDNHKPWNL